jgi:sodium transport system ATP-binding protein
MDVVLNGQALRVAAGQAALSTHDCNHPQLVSLPAALVRARDNMLDIKVTGHTLQESGSRLRAGGLSALQIGPQSELEHVHARQTALQVAAPQAISATLVLMGSFMFVLGFINRRESHLAYFGALQGMDAAAIAARTDTLARGLGMTDFLDRRVGTFSTGMKQKTSIARTLIHDPSVIILDEPTLGLDVMAARAILRFVRDCRDRGKTVIYSTHVMPEVERLCDRVGIIHGGRLLAEGTVAELRQRAGKTDLEDVFVALTGAEKEEAA